MLGVENDIKKNIKKVDNNFFGESNDWPDFDDKDFNSKNNQNKQVLKTLQNLVSVYFLVTMR